MTVYAKTAGWAGDCAMTAVCLHVSMKQLVQLLLAVTTRPGPEQTAMPDTAQRDCAGVSQFYNSPNPKGLLRSRGGSFRALC